jgi:glycine cleavage system H protein
VGGEVVEVNETLNDSPELINEEPYGGGWMIRLRISEDGDLLSAEEYEKLVEEESE